MSVIIGQVECQMPVFLAPMAGLTDLPLRNLVAEFGAGLLVSEMVLSGEFLGGRKAAQARTALGGPLTSVQIAGREPEAMAEVARMVEGQGAPIIDINMGCPAKKVTGGLSGAALMRDEGLALDIIDKVASAVSVPVTVKMRLGWCDQSRNAASLARGAVEAGAAMITVHGRTRDQFYKGEADWASIREVVEAVPVPVVANGDITDTRSAREALAQSGAAAVMVGRGAIGAPWRLAQIAAGLRGEAYSPPSGSTLAGIITRHYEAMLSFYGRDLGVRVARKHLDAYLAPCPDGAAIRRRVIAEPDPARVLCVLADELEGALAWAA